MAQLKRTRCLVFESFSISDDGSQFEFFFNADGKVISREFSINLDLSNQDKGTVQNIIFHIGLFCLLDLDQVLLPEKVKISAAKLTKEQIDFYKTARELYCRQHFFERRLPFSILSDEVVADGPAIKRKNTRLKNNQIVMAFGGGKESNLAHAIFSKLRAPVVWFLKTRKPYRETLLGTAASKNLEPLIHLTEDGSEIYKNAYTEMNYASRTHTGVSIYIMTLLLGALKHKSKFICLGNERSSNDPYCFWDGKIVNHQFDKTKEYRKFIESYINKFILPDVKLFSIFEGLYEYRISELMKSFGFSFFSKMTSCNYLSNEKKWCHRCPKCAWSFAILTHAFGQKKAVEVVGADLFEDPKIFETMMNPALPKPFECIGERPEVWLILQECIERGAAGPALDRFKEVYQSHFLPNQEVWKNKFSKVHQNSDLPRFLSKELNAIFSD